jgi:hypothetical protein
MMLTAEKVREALDYDPETGVFLWKVDRCARGKGVRMRAGSLAGGPTACGYWRVFIGRNYQAHRLAWLYVYGEWPSREIDHIDGDRRNNRIANLRLATSLQNKGNMKRRADNSSGFKGVIFCKFTGRWRSRIRHNGRVHCLGRHSTPEAAHVAYREAAERLFGEFARA